MRWIDVAVLNTLFIVTLSFSFKMFYAYLFLHIKYNVNIVTDLTSINYHFKKNQSNVSKWFVVSIQALYQSHAINHRLGMFSAIKVISLEQLLLIKDLWSLEISQKDCSNYINYKVSNTALTDTLSLIILDFCNSLWTLVLC
jgi:hypothetical protein